MRNVIDYVRRHTKPVVAKLSVKSLSGLSEHAISENFGYRIENVKMYFGKNDMSQSTKNTSIWDPKSSISDNLGIPNSQGNF